MAIPRGTLKPTSDGIRNTSATPSPAGVNGRGGQNTGDAVAHQQPARAEGVTDRADAAPQRGGVQQPQGGDPFHHGPVGRPVPSLALPPALCTGAHSAAVSSASVARQCRQPP